MPSRALARWRTTAGDALDEIIAAHRAVEGRGRRGRRFATLQVTHAYALMLAGQFQGFCRDLDAEAVDFLVAAALPSGPASLADALQSALVYNRAIDRANPREDNLARDFGRYGGMQLWTEVQKLDKRSKDRRARLGELLAWRNAIAHQDWRALGSSRLHLKRVDGWRSVCNALALSFDRALGDHLRRVVGRAPW